MQLRKPTIALFAATLAALACGASPALAATSGSGLYIEGGGYGHDIGMSQYGAGGFAEHGYGYRQILSHYYSGTTLGKISGSRTVTVLIAQGAATFTGVTTIAGSKIKLNANDHYGVFQSGNRIMLMSDGRKVKSGKSVAKFSAPLTVSGPGPVDLIAHGRYRGSMTFRFDGNGFDAINSVNLNDYVRGVISAEMPSSWPQQALNAQAVAARTYAITSGAVAPGRYMLYDDTRSQMYEGVSAETASTDAAVKATSDQVVEYGGEPVTTYFFASSGGHTKSIQFSWGVSPEPWLLGVSDPYDDSFGNPYHSWRKSFALDKAGNKLGGYVKGVLKGIKVTSSTAEIVGSGGTIDVDGADLEGAFGTLSPNMSFTTIHDHAASATIASGSSDQSKAATSGSASASASASTSSSAAAGSSGAVGLVRTAKAAKAAKTTKVHEVAGSIFPVHKNATVTAQRDDSGVWKAVASARLSAAGKFTIRVSGAGKYRVAYAGIDGPAITIK